MLEESPAKISFKDQLANFEPPVDRYTGNSSWCYSEELVAKMAGLYNGFSSALEALPKCSSSSIEPDPKTTIQVELSLALVNAGEAPSKGREWVVVPTYRLPEGTRIQFSAKTNYLRPTITLACKKIPDRYDDEANFGYMQKIIGAIDEHPEWRVGVPTLQLTGDETVIIREAAKSGLIQTPEDEETKLVVSMIPRSIQGYLPSAKEIQESFYPSVAELSSITDREENRAASLADIKLVRVDFTDRDQVKALPAGYKDYYVQVTSKRQTGEITLPLQTDKKGSFGALAEIMQRDEKELTIEFSLGFYENYQRRISQELETILNFLGNSLDIDRSIRAEVRKLADKIRLMRQPDLGVFGMHLKGATYIVDDKAAQGALVDLDFVKEVSNFFAGHDVLQSLMVARQDAQALRVTDYLNDVITIMTDLSEGRVSDKVKELLQGKTVTGDLTEEIQEKIRIDDFGGGMIAPSYHGVTAEIARAALELTIDVSGNQPQYVLRIGTQRRIEEALNQARKQGLGDVADAHIDQPFAILADGQMVYLPNGGYYLNPQTGLVVYSEKVMQKNREKDLKLAQQMVAKLNPGLRDDKKVQIAEDIVNSAYRTVSADPERLLEQILQLDNLKGRTPEKYEEVDFTELAAAFLPYQSSQEGVTEEKFTRFCKLFGIDQTQVSTWCLNGNGITFRLYKITKEDDSYLGVALFKTDSLNQNNAVGYSYVRGNDLGALIDHSKQQMIELGIPRDKIQERNPTETIGITDLQKGYTLKEAIQSIFVE